jgi:hypothetical protein
LYLTAPTTLSVDDFMLANEVNELLTPIIDLGLGG